MAQKKKPKKAAPPRKRRKTATDSHPIWDSPGFMPEASPEYRDRYREVNLAGEALEDKWQSVRVADGGGLSQEHCQQYWAEQAAWRKKFNVDPPAKKLDRDTIKTLAEFVEWIKEELVWDNIVRGSVQKELKAEADGRRAWIVDTIDVASTRLCGLLPTLKPLRIHDAKARPAEAVLAEALAWAVAPATARDVRPNGGRPSETGRLVEHYLAMKAADSTTTYRQAVQSYRKRYRNRTDGKSEKQMIISLGDALRYRKKHPN